MQLKTKNLCPLLKKECIGLDCAWFTQLRGKHPQSGEEIDEWGCSVVWLPILLVENAKETRQGAAAVESFRNEVARVAASKLITNRPPLVDVEYTKLD